MKMFFFEEGRYYRFGLAMGLANLARNGFRLGTKKTLGKICQPINSYTRFPEYHFLGTQIEDYLTRLEVSHKPRVLDVGSPKCFGLYLAFHFDIEIRLTDIDAASVREAETLWQAIKDRAKGTALFSTQDARSLKYPDEQFHITYSMSAVEHVEGDAGDSDSVREMLRVTKPGGLLLLTVPIGESYVEQERTGFQGAARETGDGKRYFFQRVYTPAAAQQRIINAVSGATLRRAVTISRKNGPVSSLYRRLGPNLRGLIGTINPVLSVALNASREGILPARSDYGILHSASDVCGDLMLAWEAGRTAPVAAPRQIPLLVPEIGGGC